MFATSANNVQVNAFCDYICNNFTPLPYIVLQVEISLEVKSQWLQGSNKNFFISGMFILLKL
jgi:hypothetical protein